MRSIVLLTVMCTRVLFERQLGTLVTLTRAS
jgi:hypothetical protein